MYYGTTVTGPSATIEVAVLIGGRPQPLYRRADGRVHVPGIPGQPYSLRVTNRTSGRVEVLTSVDGRNTLKDEPADKRANAGMVLRAGDVWECKGWRVSDEQSREFLFGAPERSVAAAATGSVSNTGVIGFAVYREETWNYGGGYGGILRGAEPVAVAAAGPGPGPASCSVRSLSVTSTTNTATASPGGSLGTGIGDFQEDRVGRTEFRRASGEPDVLLVRYEAEDVLRAMGLLVPADPEAFPGKGTGYEKFTSSR
jgi:hypothetical protein